MLFKEIQILSLQLLQRSTISSAVPLGTDNDDDDVVFYAEGARSAPGLPKGMRRARVYLAIPVTRLYEAAVTHVFLYGCAKVLRLALNTRYPANQAQWQLWKGYTAPVGSAIELVFDWRVDIVVAIVVNIELDSVESMWSEIFL